MFGVERKVHFISLQDAKADISGDMTGYSQELAEKIREKEDINRDRPAKSKSSPINKFVKECMKNIETNKKDQSNILSSERDWSLSVDLTLRKIAIRLSKNLQKLDIFLNCQKLSFLAI